MTRADSNESARSKRQWPEKWTRQFPSVDLFQELLTGRLLAEHDLYSDGVSTKNISEFLNFLQTPGQIFGLRRKNDALQWNGF